MSTVINNFHSIEQDIQKKNLINKKHNIIAVSKTFTMDKILPLVESGHIHYGENKVQEALSKWAPTKKDFPEIKLHMIGKLQTNKVKKAFQIFDHIQ